MMHEIAKHSVHFLRLLDSPGIASCFIIVRVQFRLIFFFRFYSPLTKEERKTPENNKLISLSRLCVNKNIVIPLRVSNISIRCSQHSLALFLF